MNWADWSIVALVAASTLISLLRGFVKEALSLLSWLAAIFVALMFNQSMQTFLSDYIAAPAARQIVAFASLFLAVLLIGALVNYLVSSLIKATGLTGTDRVLGMVFGFVRGVLLVLVIIMMMSAFMPIEQDFWYRQSVLIPQVMMLETWFMATAMQLWAIVEQRT